MLTAEKTPVATKLMTAQEAFQLGTVNRRFELVKGVYVEMSPAGAQHGDIIISITLLIAEHVRKNRLGRVAAAETGFRLARDPDTVRGADVAFISSERIPADGVPVGYWQLAPDLAVEVVSPTDRPDEVQEKVQDYLAAGTRMVWLVYPKTRSVVVYRSFQEIKIVQGDDHLSGEDVLPGFECRVSAFFT